MLARLRPVGGAGAGGGGGEVVIDYSREAVPTVPVAIDMFQNRAAGGASAPARSRLSGSEGSSGAPKAAAVTSKPPPPPLVGADDASSVAAAAVPPAAPVPAPVPPAELEPVLVITARTASPPATTVVATAAPAVVSPPPGITKVPPPVPGHARSRTEGSVLTRAADRATTTTTGGGAKIVRMGDRAVEVRHTTEEVADDAVEVQRMAARLAEEDEVRRRAYLRTKSAKDVLPPPTGTAPAPSSDAARAAAFARLPPKPAAARRPDPS